jgi:hypothetical protein
MRPLVRLVRMLVVANLVTLAVGQLLKRAWPSTGNSQSPTFDRTAVMGGDWFESEYDGFERGSIQVIMGSSRTDLSSATIVPGASLEVFVKAGGAEIVVPRGTTVELVCNDVLSDVINLAEPADDEAADLVIDAQVFFGGLRVVAGA